MTDQLKELIRIAESVIIEIRKNYATERSVADESVDIDDTYISVFDSPWDDNKHYTIRFYPKLSKAKRQGNIEIQWFSDAGLKVNIKDYFYFTTSGMNKLVNNNKDLLEKFCQEINKRTLNDKQERIAELERQIAKLKV